MLFTCVHSRVFHLGPRKSVELRRLLLSDVHWQADGGSICLPSCKGTNPIRCISPRSGTLFGHRVAPDGMHEVGKTRGPRMGPRKHKRAGGGAKDT